MGQIMALSGLTIGQLTLIPKAMDELTNYII